MSSKDFRLNIFFKEACFFVLAQLLALVGIWYVHRSPLIQKAMEKQKAQSPTVGGFLLQFLIATSVFLLLLPLFKRKPIFLKILLYLAFFVGIGVYAEIFIGQPWALIIAVAAILAAITFRNLLVHNLVIILALAGIGTVLGLTLDSLTIVFILAILAFYDLVAVYVTKHMVKMAKATASKGVLFGVAIPKKTTGFFKKTNNVKLGKKSSYYFLGGGDIALPLVLVVSTANSSLWKGVVVAFFSLLGLLLMHIMFTKRKKRKPMPGLPPLVFSTLLGFLIVSLI